MYFSSNSYHWNQTLCLKSSQVFIIVMDVRCYRELKLLGVDMFTKLGLCLILFNQVWASLAACKTGQWYLHGIGTVRGLKAGCATTGTPYLVVLLPFKRGRAEQRSSVWFVWECERETWTELLSLLSYRKGRRISNFATITLNCKCHKGKQ